MITFGPVYSDYAIMACCMGWLAPHAYNGARYAWAIACYLRRRRHNRVTLRITSSNGPGYDRAARLHARLAD